MSEPVRDYDGRIDRLQSLFDRSVVGARIDFEHLRQSRSRGRHLRTAAIRSALGLAVVAFVVASVFAIDRNVLTGQSTSVPSSRGLDAFEARYAQWLDGLDLAAINWATLPRDSLIGGSRLPPPQSLQAAYAAAVVIVKGSVVGLQPEREPIGTKVTIRVSEVIKGSAASTVDIIQGSGLEADPSWGEPHLGEDEGDPLLMPGQSVILLLQNSGRPDGLLVAEYATGIYYLTSDGMQPLDANPFASTVSGVTEAVFVGWLR